MKQRKEFVISDLHFGHKNIIKHRTQFKTIEDHDNYIIDNWNKVVSPEDKVYVLGDVAWHKSDLAKIGQLNGTKILIAGNHDWHRTKDYLKYFKNVRGLYYKQPEDVWLSHAPIHVNHLRGKLNIHGHLHTEIVWTAMNEETLEDFPDRSYINVSCEQVNYTPVEINKLLNKGE